MGDQAGGQAARQSHEKVFRRFGPPALAQENGRFIQVEDLGVPRGVLLLTPAETIYGGPIGRSPDPFVFRPEFKFGLIRVLSEQIHGAGQLLQVDPVYDFLPEHFRESPSSGLWEKGIPPDRRLSSGPPSRRFRERGGEIRL
jgi:hypothetical protein